MDHLQSRLQKEGLSVTSEADKGRCLISCRAFLPGQTVLDQDPYVSVLGDDSRSKRCDGCFKEFSSLKRCSACKFVWYCSSVCQKSNWTLHQQECKVLVRLRIENSRMPTPSLQLMLRLLIKRQLQASNIIPTTSIENYDIIRLLPTHYSKTDQERLVLYAQMATLVKTIIQAADEDIKDITENFCRFSCNAHTICDDELRPVGTGLFPVVSIINHSCSPNCVLMFEGKHAIVRAIQKIERGSEVTVSYIELGANTVSRRSALSKQYFFNCECSKCAEDSSGSDREGILEGVKCPNQVCGGFVTLDNELNQWKCVFCGSVRSCDDVKSLASEAEAMLGKATQLQSSTDFLEARRIYEQLEKLQMDLWHPQSMQLMRTRDLLLKVYLSLQDWDSALSCCRLTIPAYETAYSQGNHPLLGLQFYTLGKLELHNGNTEEAVKALTRASDILSVTHGSRGQFVKELSTLLDQAKAEAHCIAA